MTDTPRFRCPACGFAVFNRRLPACESCHAPLPAQFQFTAAERALIEEDAARMEKIRRDLALEAERMREQAERRRGDGG